MINATAALNRAQAVESVIRSNDLDPQQLWWKQFERSGKHQFRFSVPLLKELEQMDTDKVPGEVLEFLPYDCFFVDLEDLGWVFDFPAKYRSVYTTLSVQAQGILFLRAWLSYKGEERVGWDPRASDESPEQARAIEAWFQEREADSSIVWSTAPGWVAVIALEDRKSATLAAQSAVAFELRTDMPLDAKRIAEVLGAEEVRVHDAVEIKERDEAREGLSDIARRSLHVALGAAVYLAQPEPDDTAPIALSLGKKQPTKQERKALKCSSVVTAVGYRFAAASAASKSVVHTNEHTRTTSAHVRKAHWHTYRVGVGRTQTRAKFLSPILVGGKADIGVIHR